MEQKIWITTVEKLESHWMRLSIKRLSSVLVVPDTASRALLQQSVFVNCVIFLLLLLIILLLSLMIVVAVVVVVVDNMLMMLLLL